MTKDEALRLALEALEWSKPHADAEITYQEAMTAIKAALEAKDEPVVWNGGVPAMLPKQKEGETFIVSYEPKLEAKDEPVAVAWANRDGTKFVGNGRKWIHQDCVIPLYTTPPQRKPLTDDDLSDIADIATKTGNLYDLRLIIEAKLKEKNG